MKTKIIGIIVEWNPFHNGHIIHINKIRKRYPNCIIVAALSGSIVQRGEISIIDKFLKTKVAIDNGIDIVIEIPVKYITQYAANFSNGAIKLLNEFNVDIVISGSESNNVEEIKKNVELYRSIEYDSIRKLIKEGYSYPKIISKLIGKDMLPNDILNKCYLTSIQDICPKMRFETILRKTIHDNDDIIGKEASGSLIRNYIENELSYEKYIPKYEIQNIYYTKDFLDLIKLNILQSKNNTNISNQLKKIIETTPSVSFAELSLLGTAKSHTQNKVKRYMMEELFQINYGQKDIYRVLGFSTKGSSHLKQIKKDYIVSTFDKRLVNENNISKIINIKYPGFFEKNLKYKPYK